MKPSLLTIYTITAFTITFLFLPVLIKLLSQWRIFDSPGKHKIHNDYIPSMGGVCILIGAFFAQAVGMPFVEWPHLKYFYLSIAIMFITGLRDDILTLTPRQKLIGQILPIIILVVFGDVGIWSFYNNDLNDVVFPDLLAWIITIFTIVILTNAYNLIDGLDGLAGMVGLITLFCFGTWFYLAGDTVHALVAFSFAGSLAAFLVFNWEPSRIFMGDTGALVIGLLLSYLTIRFINWNYGLPEGDPIKFRASVATAVMFMIIPVFDTLRVIILRLRRFQSPFRADKNHLHHQFLKMGFSHAKTTLFLAGLHVFFITLALVLKNTSDSLLLPIVIVACIVINQTIKAAQRRHERNGRKSLITEN